MWNKQKRKRIFKSFICMVLAVLIFITVPDWGLVLKVMANPKPNQLVIAEEQAETEVVTKSETDRIEYEYQERETSSEYEAEGIPETANEKTETKSVDTYTSENIETEMTEWQEHLKESETEVASTESVGENSSVKKVSEYVKTVIPEDIVYDEIIDGDTVLSSGGVIRDKKIL